MCIDERGKEQSANPRSVITYDDAGLLLQGTCIY